MKLTCYKTTTCTSFVVIEIDDNATDEDIERQANLIGELHGVKIINDEEFNWCVEHDEETITEFRNPHTM